MFIFNDVCYNIIDLSYLSYILTIRYKNVFLKTNGGNMTDILFVGYSATHPEDFEYVYTDSNNFYLLLLINSAAEIMVDGVFQQVTAGTVILYAPNQKIYYRACGEEYKNDWIRFTSDETFVTQFNITGLPFSVADTEYYHNLFKLITWESHFNSASSELVIENLMRALFLKLKEDSAISMQNPHTTSLLALRKKIYNSPNLNWSISLMSKELHMSSSYLQLLYKKSFDISCMDDVIESRIRYAKDQLIYTDKTVLEIAEQCGYNNVEHFCRQFKKLTSYTPLQYRSTYTH